MQTRRFVTSDEGSILTACAGLLQDLGFIIDDSETDLGFILASKERSAVEAGQVFAAILVAALTGVATPTDEKQTMRVSIVTRPLVAEGVPQGMAVRVTFQRVVINTQGMVSRREALNEPEIYQQFFEMLSEAVFLEAHDV